MLFKLSMRAVHFLTAISILLLSSCYPYYTYPYPYPYAVPGYSPTRTPKPLPVEKKIVRPVVAPGEYRLWLRAPDIAENGHVVPVTVEGLGLKEVGRRAEAIHIFSCQDRAHLAGFDLPVRTLPYAATRIKLRRTSDVIATALLDNGEVISDTAIVKVTIGGMGDAGPDVRPENHDRSMARPVRFRPMLPTTWKRSDLLPNQAQFLVESHSIPISSYRADVLVEGFTARVLIDFEFRQDVSQFREGVFQLRLPDGGSPYYIAFGDTSLTTGEVAGLSDKLTKDVGVGEAVLDDRRPRKGGVLREARMAKRAEAGNAYHSIVDSRRDPALVEWQGDGVYSVRVFPVEKGRNHRVVVGYDMPLMQQKGGDYRYTFTPPEGVTDAELHLRLPPDRVDTLQQAPMPVEERMLPGQAVWTYRHVPVGGLDFVFENRDTVWVGEEGSQAYFATRIVPVPPVGLKVKGADKAVLAIDTSVSSRRDFQNYLDFSVRLLAENADSISEFALLLFDVEARWWRPAFIANTRANRKLLANALQAVTLDGATDLRLAMHELSVPSGLSYQEGDEWDAFILTDGADTWHIRQQDIGRTLGDDSRIRHLYAYSSEGSGNQLDQLDAIARRTGGALYQLQDVRRVPALLTAHRYEGWQIESIKVPGANDVIMVGNPRHLYRYQPIVITGRGRPEGGFMQLMLSNAGERVVIDQAAGNQKPSITASRVFGQAAVAMLETQGNERSEDAFALARHFRVPRETASLLMLESEEDYYRYDVDGPSFFDRKASSVTVNGWLTRPESGHAVERRAAEMAIPDKMFMRIVEGQDLSCEQWAFAYTLLKHTKALMDPAVLRESASGGQAGPGYSVKAKKLQLLRKISGKVEEFGSDLETLSEMASGLQKAGLYADAYMLWTRYLIEGGDSLRAIEGLLACVADAGLYENALRGYDIVFLVMNEFADGDIRSQYVQLLNHIVRLGISPELTSDARQRLLKAKE